MLAAHWEHREYDLEVFSLKKNFPDDPPAIGILCQAIATKNGIAQRCRRVTDRQKGEGWHIGNMWNVN